MMIQCAKCSAKNDLDEGVNRENAYCHSCSAPLSEDFLQRQVETVEHNAREIQKIESLRWRHRQSN